MPDERRPPFNIHLSGTDAVLLDAAGTVFSDDCQRLIWAVADALNAMPFVRDCVPGMNNLLVVFDADQTSHPAVNAILAELWATAEPKSIVGREIVATVRYGGDEGPDLASLADHCGLSPREVIRLHTSSSFTVVAIGGMPGFPFLAGLDPRLHCPRRSVPRLSLDKGSVIIGGAQASIMPCTAPGGWNIIGRTGFSLFDSAQDPPTALRLGDTVRFVADEGSHD